MFPDWTVFLSCVFITLSVFCARLLSFLFHLLGEGEQRGEMGDGRGRKTDWRENGEGVEWREMGMHEKDNPETQHFRYRSVSHIFRKLSSGTTFLSQIVCLYLELFKSNGASKLTTLKKSLQKLNIFEL